ncbi:MAG: DUF438 domain-containing protein [Anaerolineae bacterium]|nr:DUF438 domain-containing protein [Anaerolineae bacterium]
MSEFINNVSRRKQQLKNVLEQLHQGRSVEEVQEEFGHLVREASSSEIAEIEQMLINEGTSPEAIQLLCDVHVAVFKEALEKNADPETQPGHPVFIFRKENLALNQLLEEIGSTLGTYDGADNQALYQKLSGQIALLQTFERHYSRKENLLFPYLEKHGFTGPSSVMWGIHDQIRASLRDLKEALERLPENSADLKARFSEVAGEMQAMIYKEEKILFPAAIERLSPVEWLMISEQEAEIGYFQIEQPSRAIVQPVSAPGLNSMAPARAAVRTMEGGLDLQTGVLSQEQINLMLTHLPVDITFVDENDEVRFFSQTKDRIFVRQPAIIGRKVQNCHPPQSVSKVQQIVSDFRNRKRDTAEFWIQMNGKFIHIRYFAVRDAAGNYRGTIEVSQDVTDIRKLEGERRLLDEPAVALN